MPITILDLALLAVMLISGLLAMVRGFMREILSIAAWGAAALVTLYAFGKLLPTAKTYFNNDTVASVVVVAGVFIGTLIVVSIITVRISDMILDSRIGALDRTLGLIFGLARGLLIVVVAFFLFSWFVPAGKLPEGIRDAKSREALQSTGRWLQSLLPQDMDNYLSSLISSVFKKQQQKGTEPDTPDAPPAPPGKRSDRGGPAGTPNTRNDQAGYDRSDR